VRLQNLPGEESQSGSHGHSGTDDDERLREDVARDAAGARAQRQPNAKLPRANGDSKRE
jgi:hypothetical protein